MRDQGECHGHSEIFFALDSRCHERALSPKKGRRTDHFPELSKKFLYFVVVQLALLDLEREYGKCVGILVGILDLEGQGN